MRLSILLHLVLAGTAALPCTAAAQSALPPATLLRAARTIIAASKYATFITLDSAGAPQSRTVQPVAPDSAMTVRFATNPRSRKVGEVERDGRASLHYFDEASLAYVALVGHARLIRDKAEKARFWNPAWSQFYPDKDTSVVLIEVTPERLEVVDIKRGINGDERTWRAPSVPIRQKSSTTFSERHP